MTRILKTNQKPLNLQFEKEAKVEAVVRTNSLLLVAFWPLLPPALDNVVALRDTSWKAKNSNSTCKRSSHSVSCQIFRSFLVSLSKYLWCFKKIVKWPKFRSEHCHFTELFLNGFEKPSFLLKAGQILERYQWIEII